AIMLHLLHIVDEHVVLPIILALLGLLFINFIRHTRNNEFTAEQVDLTAYTVGQIQSSLKRPDVLLIGPRRLRSANEYFISNMSGDTIWFNVCLTMYRPSRFSMRCFARLWKTPGSRQSSSSLMKARSHYGSAKYSRESLPVPA